MRSSILVLALGLICALASLGFAQGPADQAQAAQAAKERQARLNTILEETISQVRELRLPENRAYAYALAGRALWDQDQTRALSSFQLAGAELAAAMEAAATRAKTSQNRYYYDPYSTNFRQSILNTIGEKDAALALDILFHTRPSPIVKAMTAVDPRDKRITSSQNNAVYILQNEASLENNLYRLAAEQDPTKAVAILKAALEKPLSNETLNQLNRLSEKDQSAGLEAASSIIKRVIAANYVREGQPDYVVISLSNQIVENYINNHTAKPRFDAGDVRSLATKMISGYLSNSQVRGYIAESSITRYAEQLAPAYLPQIKSIGTAQTAERPATEVEFNKLMQGDTTPDQMLAAASKFSSNQRRELYQNAANKFVNQGNFAAGRAVLEQNFTDEARDQALEEYDRNTAYRLLGEAKFTEAEAMINMLPEKARAQMLTQLAMRMYGANNKDNRAYALTLLENSRSLIGDHPSDQNEMAQMMAVTAGFAQIEPPRAFEILERLVPQINELTDAAAVLYAFQNNNNVHDGEFVITQGEPFAQFGASGYMLGQLANSDLDRTMKLIDSFSRPELRLNLRLQLVATGGAGITSLPITGRRVSNLTVLH